MYHYPNASRGIKLFFIGIVLSIVAVPLTLLLIGPLVGMAGTVLQLVGLYIAAQDDKGYQTAFYASIAALVLSAIHSFVSQNSTAATLITVISGIVSLYITYQVITITCLLLQGKDSETIAKGQNVLKIYVGTTLVSLACTVLSIIPIIGALALIVSVIAALVQLVGYVLFMIFLNHAYKSLA